jgi:predicted phosphodiesterase
MSERRRTALILSDWQCELQDDDYLNRVLRLVKDVQPDKIIHVGDESDATTIGRWVQGTPAEAEGNLQREIDTTHGWLQKYREAAPDATFQICYSNHLARFTQSITSRLPAFRHLRALSIENLFGLEELGIKYERKIFEVFPGVVAGHGHQWGLTSANQYSKGTSVVATTGASVIAGHTHRPLLTSVATGYNFDIHAKFYMNVGCGMKFSEAEYIKSTAPQWAHGTGLVHWHRDHGSHPELLVARDTRFEFRGVWY